MKCLSHHPDLHLLEILRPSLFSALMHAEYSPVCSANKTHVLLLNLKSASSEF